MPRDWPDPRWPPDKPTSALSLWILGLLSAGSMAIGLASCMGLA